MTVSATTPTREGIPSRVGTLLLMGPVLIMRLVRRTRCRLRVRTRCMPSGIPIRSRWRIARMVVRGLRDQSGDAFSDVTVSATTPTREGYSFTGWDTAADGSGTDYAAGSSYTLPASGTDTLYAQWDPNTVTLAYDANGGSGAPGDQSGDAFSDVTVSATTPTRRGIRLRVGTRLLMAPVLITRPVRRTRCRLRVRTRCTPNGTRIRIPQ